MDVNKYRSDIQELIGEINKLRMIDPQGTIEKCEELLKYGQDRRDDAIIGFASFTKGEIYYLLNDMPSFYLEMLKCIKPFQTIMEWGYMAAVYNLLGIMALNRGNAPLALDYYYKAYEYCDEHKLPEIKCMVHLNLGGLFYQVQKYDNALEHYEASYKYIVNHVGMDGYVEKLAAVLVGKGRTYLALDNISEAKEMLDEVKEKCISFLLNADKFSVDCFEATILRKESKEVECSNMCHEIAETFVSEAPIMDIFDVAYDLLSMLLDFKKYDDFEKLYDKVMGMVKISTVKNLEKKLYELKLRVFKEKGQMDEYHTLAESYIELLSNMENENIMMFSSMINLRNNYFKLNEENKEEKRKSKLFKKQAETDPLTGMANRIKLNTYAEEIFERAITNQVGFAIELLDIDFFKEYNDNYGHKAGDECLLFIANSIIKLSKSHQGVFCCRYGGDEFVIIYESFTEKEVFDMGKELKNIIVGEAKPHEHAKGNEKIVTISQGIYWGVPVDGDSVWDYLQEADSLLYKVKQKSRNSVMVGHSKGHDESGDKEDKLEHASKPLITEIKEEVFLPAED